MSTTSKFASITLAALLLGAGIASADPETGQLGQDENVAPATDPVYCEIRKDSERGTISLSGLVRSEIPASGTYELHVISSSGGGSMNIQQQGEFSVDPDHSQTLGMVRLGFGARNYDATLKLRIEGETITCTKRIRNFI